jgi:anhydro-N-acetylmuramic acid kinase
MKKSSENKIYTAIGLMSGTAMDGIDAALIKTDGDSYIEFIGFESVPHDDDFKNRLRPCLNRTDRDANDIKAIEREFTHRQIEIINELILNNNMMADNINVIGFHGQTIHHDPDGGVTIQLGDGGWLSNQLNIPVVYDLRQADMMAGGQGAPFIPVYHAALAKNEGLELPIVIANIGGVSNITWIGQDDDLIGFDTGPGNAMIDDWVKKHTGNDYDEGGKLAKSGVVDMHILDGFLSFPYILKKYPKSLDRNDFNDLNIKNMSVVNGAATLTAMTVQGIVCGVRQCPAMPTALYVSGGGRHNVAIMDGLRDALNIDVLSVDELQWNGDSMEAEGFAYMAVRTLRNLPISFPNTTGCNAPTVGGVVAYPQERAA